LRDRFIGRVGGFGSFESGFGFCGVAFFRVCHRQILPSLNVVRIIPERTREFLYRDEVFRLIAKDKNESELGAHVNILRLFLERFKKSKKYARLAEKRPELSTPTFFLFCVSLRN